MLEDNSIKHKELQKVQTTHQGDVTYDIYGSIQRSCMSLMSVTWTLFRSPGMWDKFDSEYILGKGGSVI